MKDIDKETIFKSWVEKYFPFGYRVARGILENDEEARDTVQDGFVKVWQNMDRYRDEIPFSTWFYRIIVNICYDRLRKMKQNHAYIASNMGPAMYAEDQSLQFGDGMRLLKNLSGRLSRKQRTVFVLRDLEDLSVEEVAAITSMDPDQIKTNLYHARKAIREMLIQMKIQEDFI